MIYRFLLVLFILFLPVNSAQAAWHEASSDHFLIYGNQKASEIREFAERLERFHAAMSVNFGRTTRKSSPSNRVTVFVVGSRKNVRELAGKNAKRVGGFYIPRAGKTLAVVPRLKKGRNSREFTGETVLLHEYAHHYMYQLTSSSWPRWFSEGFAEFYGSAKFFQDGAVGLGAPADHRAYGLAYGRSVPIELLLDTDAYQKSKSQRYDTFYGQSWLLYHYLAFDEQRKPQFSRYKKLLVDGIDELEAAKTAFGDLRKLNVELKRYQKRKRLTYIHLPPEQLNIGPVFVRALRAGEAAIMPHLVQSKRGVNDKQAAILLPKIQAVAAQYPSDPAVLATLAEAEYDAGNDDATIAAADRAISLDRRTVNAYVQKGYALARKAQDTADDAALWKATRRTFVALNKIENDHPIPLIWFYRTYIEQGKLPTKLAIDGLEWALQLAPYDQSLRMTVARQQSQDGRTEMAIKTLRPLANSPHENAITKAAGALIKKLAEEQKRLKGRL